MRVLFGIVDIAESTVQYCEALLIIVQIFVDTQRRPWMSLDVHGYHEHPSMEIRCDLHEHLQDAKLGLRSARADASPARQHTSPDLS